MPFEQFIDLLSQGQFRELYQEISLVDMLMIIFIILFLVKD